MENCDGAVGGADEMVGMIWTGDPADEGVYPPNPAPVHSGRIGCCGVVYCCPGVNCCCGGG